MTDSPDSVAGDGFNVRNGRAANGHFVDSLAVHVDDPKFEAAGFNLLIRHWKAIQPGE
jgi:hypothetical protein